MPSRLAHLWALLPLCGVAVFIATFATATPLTDEWLFVRGALRFSEAHTLSEMWNSLVFGLYNHVVIVPFVLVYLPLGFATGFDARALIVVTVLCHASVLFALARRYSPPPLVLFCASLLVFSPARYVELLWGFNYTIAMSIAFAAWALFVCDRMRAGDSARTHGLRFGCALLLLVLGVLSSAGGYFGFPAAVAVIAIKRLEPRRKLACAVVLSVVGCALFLALRRGANDLSFAWSDLLVASAAAGTAIVSTPVAVPSTVTLDVRAILGALFLLIALAAIVRARSAGMLDELALAIGFVVYGVLAVLGVAFNRHYVTNWHVQHLLPALSGALVLSWIVWQRSRASFDRRLWIGACSLAFLGCAGWCKGWLEGGPYFHAYVRDVERYIVTYELSPDRPKPFPTTRLWDIDRPMIEFLRAQGHPLLNASPDRRSATR